MACKCYPSPPPRADEWPLSLLRNLSEASFGLFFNRDNMTCLEWHLRLAEEARNAATGEEKVIEPPAVVEPDADTMYTHSNSGIASTCAGSVALNDRK
jgi:hypothetical protein